MADVFTVGALALAAEGANAVGAVHISLFENEMEIELVRLAHFERGFVMAGIAKAAPVRFPYTAVRGLVRRGRALCLALDPKIGSPYTRFTLAHFTSDPRDALAHVYDSRRRAAIYAALMPLVAGAIVTYAAPEKLASGVVGRLSAGVVVALVTWVILRDLLAVATWGGAASDRLSEAFEQALCAHLGLSAPPRTTTSNQPLILFESDAAPSSTSSRAPSWARPAIVVVGASIALVAAVAFFRKYSKPPDKSEGNVVTEPAAKISSVWSAPSAVVSVPEKPRLPRCVCARPSSSLWNDGISALEVLFAAKPDDGSGVVVPVMDRRNRPKYEFDASVVNNASKELPDVTLLLTFARRNAAGERVGATDRGLYFAGPLLPGRAVKWHVKAPGSEIRIEPSVTGMLPPDRPAAPADAFVELAKANQRVVRIHAAKMLAYHRDPRASEVLTNLGAPNPGEEKTLARISRSLQPVFTCEIQTAKDVSEVCLVNTTLEIARVSALIPLSAEDKPLERQVLDVEVPVHDGVRVRLPVALSPAPAEIGVELAK